MSINERVNKIITDLFNGNKTAFSKRIDVKPTTVSNIVNERATKPSSEILKNIIKAIPEINPSWLLTGEGEMLKSESTDENKRDAEILISREVFEQLNRLTETVLSQQRTIENLIKNK